MSSPPATTTTEEIFEDSLLSLFQHRPIAFSTRGPDDPYIYRPSGIRLSRHHSTDQSAAEGNHVCESSSEQLAVTNSNKPPSTITVYLPTAPPELHSTLQLTHLWLSSVFLSDLISHELINVHNERICELGAGAGLPGIVSAVKGARQVVATDYAVHADTDKERVGAGVLDVLRGNYVRSVVPGACEGEEGEGEGKSWAVLGHTWGDERSVERVLSSPCSADFAPGAEGGGGGREKFTLLLLADLLWSTSAHGALISSLGKLLDPRKGCAHVVAGLHQGRGPIQRFLRSWKQVGGWVRYQMEVQWGIDDAWEVLEDFRGGQQDERWECLYDEERDGGDEHGTVVYFVIGLAG